MIWTPRHNPKRDPKFHQVEMFAGVGRSISASFTIFRIGWDLRRLTIKVLIVEKQQWFFSPPVLVKVRIRIMTFILYTALLVIVVGLGAVVAHPSPYFGSLTLVVVSGAACVVLIMYGGTFLALVMFLVYLGGMLVVFAYTTALAADSFPYTLTYGDVMLYWALYMGISLVCYIKYIIMGDIGG